MVPVHMRPESPPEAWPPLVRFVRIVRGPIDSFLHIEAASGILLFLAAAVAIGFANSSLAESYARFWDSPIGIRFGPFGFERSVAWFVNDGLMAIFFFVVGLEIRREIYQGELSELRRAALPFAAAIGGILVPAGLYLLIAGVPEIRRGWGVPMATDIAFAVGVLTILGKRVPATVRVLLLTLAVIDDLGAILVIAIFYSDGVALGGILTSLVGFGFVLAMQRMGVRHKLAYLPPSLLAWAGVYAAGIHPTIAGVILGMITPVQAWMGPAGFLRGIKSEITDLEAYAPEKLPPTDLAASLQNVEVLRREALSPAESLITGLHSWVAFGIMPIFALANAGVPVSFGSLDTLSVRVVIGVAVGLVVGKPLGIFLASYLVQRLGIATLPTGVNSRHVLLLGCVAGIGFTMALFIGQLAFEDQQHLDAAKIGILAASLVAAVLGLVGGRLFLSEAPESDAA